jgi:protein involved in polysaccharide export with SLBB domain
MPPGYFDLPPRVRQEGVVPTPIIKPGDILVVETLEALPGRPITGERLVRADGTISLGFYGELAVAGLNRHEVKIKLIEHLRKYINDETLGLLMPVAENHEFKYISPVDSNRVFVTDDVNYPRKYAVPGVPMGPAQVGQVIEVEVLEALPARPITGQYMVGPDGTMALGFYGDVYVLGLSREQIKVKVIEHLRKYINDEALGLIEVEKGGNRKVVPASESSRVFIDDAILPSGPSMPEAVKQLRGQVNDLNIKLDRILKELEEIRRERGPAKP